MSYRGSQKMTDVKVADLNKRVLLHFFKKCNV